MFVLLFRSVCTVNGAFGDGSEQGTCGAGDLCFRDGVCYASTYTFLILYIYIYIYIKYSAGKLISNNLTITLL